MARQNVYDDETFFDGYAQMRARGTGLHERVVDAAVRQLLPDLTDKRVVDLGCGDGWFARIAIELGAGSVIGIDPSERMLELARARTPGASFIRAFAEDAELPPASADAVVSILALHYVEDIAAVLSSVAQWLAPGGVFLIVVEHPFATAVKPRADRAALDEQTTIQSVIERYLEESPIVEQWFTDGVIKYHRTLGCWVTTIAQAGMSIVDVSEPAPSDPSTNAQGISLRQPVLAISARRPDAD